MSAAEDTIHDFAAFREARMQAKAAEPPFTEDQVAAAFAERFAGRFRYCNDAGRWYAWTGAIWAEDRTGEAIHQVRLLAREMAQDEAIKARVSAGRSAFVGGSERLSRADPIFSVTSDGWDKDPFLLGTPAGAVNLRTGRLSPPDPAHGITKSTAVGPAETASCPLWLRFLDEATGGDTGLVRFLQQWAGYGLTGDVREHALVFVHGPGGNGKSVFLNTITGLLADYADIAAMDTFTASKSDKHPTDLAMLRGARLVTASETEEGRAWAEAKIKAMTGGDPITARFMRQDFFTYRPQFKLTIIGNHKPVLQNVDEAARRRFNIVPFTLKPKNPDRELEAKLKTEWAAILRWAIDGCLDWQANGLVRPEIVRTATEAYFSDQDLFGQWLDDECNVEPGNPHRWATSAELLASWKAYADRSGTSWGNGNSFAEAMQRRGLEKSRGAKGVRSWRGVELKQAC